MQTPIILIVFKRPETTRIVFDSIRMARPEKLFVVADGPRSERSGEAELCALTREVVESVDWPCDVVKLYSEKNLGCKNRVASGIGEVFESVDRAIILEDDCVPSPSFFRYCEELLERYADDKRVMTISGDNHLFGKAVPEASYYFSRYPHLWGWATWSRAWNLCDLEMNGWPSFRDKDGLKNLFDNPAECFYWRDLLNYVHAGKIDTWDYQWVYSIWAQHGLSVVPKRNLVANVGFNGDATHTKNSSRYASLDAGSLTFPLALPESVCPDYTLDRLERSNRERNGLPYPITRIAKYLKRKILGGR